MSSTKNPGRVAGLYYLLLIAMGPLFLIYIPDKLYVKGNAAATVSNIAAHERLFRLGILAEHLSEDPNLAQISDGVELPLPLKAQTGRDRPGENEAVGRGNDVDVLGNGVLRGLAIDEAEGLFHGLFLVFVSRGQCRFAAQ